MVTRAYLRAYNNSGGGPGRRRNPFVTFLLAIVAVWVLISVLGILVRGLFFLTVIGLVLVLLTGMYGAYKVGRRP